MFLSYGSYHESLRYRQNSQDMTNLDTLIWAVENGSEKNNNNQVLLITERICEKLKLFVRS